MGDSIGADANGGVVACERSGSLSPGSMMLWITSLRGADKSTLVFRLEKSLLAANRPEFVLSCENIRCGLNGDLAFNPEDRTESIQLATKVIRLGDMIVFSLISPHVEDRSRAKKVIIGCGRFRESYPNTPLPGGEGRDSEGFYRKQIVAFTGVSEPYQASQSPDMELGASRLAVDECLDRFAMLDVQAQGRG